MNLSKPKYLDFINIAVELASLIPPYSSRYSKRMYTQQQLLALYVLKQKSKLSYADFVDDFNTRDSAILELGLSTIPAPSTIRMFAARKSTELLEKMIGRSIG